MIALVALALTGLLFLVFFFSTGWIGELVFGLIDEDGVSPFYFIPIICTALSVIAYLWLTSMFFL